MNKPVDNVLLRAAQHSDSKITDPFILRPVLAVAVNALLLIIGLAAMTVLPIRQYPLIESSTITVTTSYPGATAELVQGFITTPLAQTIALAEGIDWLSSSSDEGLSTINATLKLDANSDQVLTEIMSKVNEVRYLIPSEATDPVITKSAGDATPVMFVTFLSSNHTLPQITDYLNRVVIPKLSSVEGVGNIIVAGAQTMSLRIWLDPLRMAAYGVDASDVVIALRANNVQAAPGSLKGDMLETRLRVDTEIKDVHGFRDMIVRSDGANRVLLRDIASVEIGAKATDQYALHNGRESVFIGLNASPSGNPLTIVRDIERLLSELRSDLPPGMDGFNSFSVARFVNASIRNVVQAIVESIAIVALVMYLFLGNLRSALIPIITIPLALIGTAALMLVMGFSLNLLTLLAVVLAIGLVVDDAIVVVENVHRHIEQGKSGLQAAIHGAREVIGPVIAMTLTLIVVYTPIGFMGGFTGALFREFSFTIAASVLVSGVIALTLSPMMANKLMHSSAQQSRFSQKLDSLFAKLSQHYAQSLKYLIEHRILVVIAASMLLSTLPVLYLGSERELAPMEDEGTLYVALKAPLNVNIDYTREYAEAMEELMHTIPEVESSFSLVGWGGINETFGGMNVASWEQRERSISELQSELQQRSLAVDGIQAIAFPLRTLPGASGGMPVQFVVATPGSTEALFDTVEEIKQNAWSSGLFAVVDSDLQMSKPVLSVSVDRPKASALGVPMQSIADTLALFLNENFVGRFQLMGRSYEIIPQVAREYRQQEINIENYYVKSRRGNMVPLATLVDLKRTVGPDSLKQFDQLNAVTISAIPLPGISMGKAVEFFEEQNIPIGFSHDWLGESRQYVEEGNQLLIAFAFAMIVIYIVLAAQFNSFIDPFTILVSVPLSLVGALFCLYVGWSSLNIYTQIGLVTLIGLISKHGILMVDFANHLQLENIPKSVAIVEAAKVRLRPILMTTAAMVAGLIPLLQSSGAGAASRFSIGLVIVSGMLVGTLFTLFILPVVYTCFTREKRLKNDTDSLSSIQPEGC